jgi:hypothetical protein
MGRRGVSHHLRGEHAAKTFEELGVTCAFLGANKSWTSFAPLSEIEGAAIAQALGVSVVQIWSDDDAGANIAFYAPDGWTAELPITHDADGISASDRALLAELTRRKIVTRAQSANLASILADARVDRREWLAGDGLEEVFGVPAATPMPLPCSPELLAELAPSAEIVKPLRRRTLARGTTAPPPPAPVVAVDRDVLALHVHYWTHIFQMNGWKLYNRYKKHLPAERRREVDRLCDLVAMGTDDETALPRAVERILSAIWTDDDWRAAIRDPRLAADEPLDADQRAEWQRLLGAGSR